MTQLKQGVLAVERGGPTQRAVAVPTERNGCPGGELEGSEGSGARVQRVRHERVRLGRPPRLPVSVARRAGAALPRNPMRRRGAAPDRIHAWSSQTRVAPGTPGPACHP